MLPFLTHEELVSLSLDKAKFNKKITLSKNIYKEQIKEHNEAVGVGTGNICHVTTAAAANLSSLKQVENTLENVEVAEPNDAYNSNNKNLSGGGAVGIGDQIQLSKKKKLQVHLTNFFKEKSSDCCEKVFAQEKTNNGCF